VNSGYIAVFDSGIGGLSVLNELIRIMPNERYIYFGDNRNSPYGCKSERELLSLTFNVISEILNYPVKAIVVGCNTLSVTILEQIQKMTLVPVFGVFPPVESCVCKGRSLLLCTPNTAKKYAKRYNGVDVLSLPYLAKDIEDKIYSLENINLDFHFSTGDFYGANQDKINFLTEYNRIILGCTHYFFVKNQILAHFNHRDLISGDIATALRVKNYLTSKKSLANNKRFLVLFLGNNAQKNYNIYYKVVNEMQK